MTSSTCIKRYAVAILFVAGPLRADIFQWEYIAPADPSQGKRQSTTLAPDGAGVDAAPGASLAGRNLTMAYLIGASQVSRTFDLFDWTGVTPTGVFAISSPYTWDLSSLYTTGEVMLTAVPEASRLALVAPGYFGLAFYRRRRIP